MPHMPRLTLVAAAVVVTSLLSACGDDDSATTTTTVATGGSASSSDVSTSGSSKQDYINAAEAGIPFEDEQIRGCVAQALISDDVYAAIKKAGVSVEDFTSGESQAQISVSQEQAASVAKDMAACGELLPQVIRGDEQQLTCAQDNITNQQLAQALSYSLFGVELPEDVQAANQAVGDCIRDTATATTVTTTTTG
jgi:hypothetical protein